MSYSYLVEHKQNIYNIILIYKALCKSVAKVMELCQTASIELLNQFIENRQPQPQLTSIEGEPSTMYANTGYASNDLQLQKLRVRINYEQL